MLSLASPSQYRTVKSIIESNDTVWGYNKGNLSPSVLAKTQVLCFSLSIRYVARLAGACPISYPYSFEA